MAPEFLLSQSALTRRHFLKGMAVGAGSLALPATLLGQSSSPPNLERPAYRGPNVIIVRFGGGVRRKETIDPKHTYSPYFLHELTQRGTFFPRMEMSSTPECTTSHGEGTLYILTGKYKRYEDVEKGFLKARFEAQVPTLFEYLRKTFAVPEHQTLIINGEDRKDEEFYTFSNHHLFGVNYRSNVLSLFRYKTYLLRDKIKSGAFKDKELSKKLLELKEMEAIDYRQSEKEGQCAPIIDFWSRWRNYYGETGLVNPRGDALLTELATRAINELKPRLMMINYQDPDYVHWGNMSHYTRGVQVIDQGLKTLVQCVDNNPEYRDNTIFAIVPDCGRDSSPFGDVPCQHHFGSKSSHEIFALFFGPGIPKKTVVDKTVDQISVAATLGHFMGFKTEHSEARPLGEAIA